MCDFECEDRPRTAYRGARRREFENKRDQPIDIDEQMALDLETAQKARYGKVLKSGSDGYGFWTEDELAVKREINQYRKNSLSYHPLNNR